MQPVATDEYGDVFVHTRSGTICVYILHSVSAEQKRLIEATGGQVKDDDSGRLQLFACSHE